MCYKVDAECLVYLSLSSNKEGYRGTFEDLISFRNKLKRSIVKHSLQKDYSVEASYYCISSFMETSNEFEITLIDYKYKKNKENIEKYLQHIVPQKLIELYKDSLI